MKDKSRTIIYIMGAGRSGTTLLDIILGNQHDITSLGEIRKYAQFDGIPKGKNIREDVKIFWKQIKNELRFENDIKYLIHKIESHLNFINLYFGLSKISSIYVKTWTKVFDKIFVKSKSNYLIDSSKYPSRLLAFNNNLNYNIKIIYILRDPASVARSFQKKNIEQPGKNYLSATIYYIIINIMCQLSYWKVDTPYKIKIKYVDLVNDTLNSLISIEKTLMIDLSRVKDIILKNDTLIPGPLFEGNRIRLMNKIKIIHNEEKRSTFKDFMIRFFCNWIYNF